MTKGQLGLVYILSVTVSWLTIFLPDSIEEGMPYVRYTSVLMVLAAVSLLLIFARMNVSEKAGTIIMRFAPAAFGVYLIHVHECIYGHFLGGSFAFLANQNVAIIILGVLCAAAAIFAVCLAIDYVRHMVFEKLQIKSRLVRLEEKLTKESCGK